MARSNTTLLLILFVLFAFCLSGNGVHAFGAGNIPSFAYMEGRAFRHGDIEDVLSQLIKRGSGGGFALASMLSKGSKFNGLDIKRVYFGNWLRDYSQAIDVASLKKLQVQTIMNLIMVLGFMAHGYATHEFEVTQERLGVYLPTEHIDNPKGYGDGEDARQYHPQLRGPVDPRELEIDPRTGMKNYIANEQGSWDTSRALVRRTLEKCIHLGRQHRSRGQKQDEYEAYRLLGQALHTLEDYSAHSNFCELSLVSLGHQQVFVHVGDNVRIQAPNGRWVAPIVTGSFGSSDFIHSLLGEASDHLSSTSVTDINSELAKARSRSMTQTRGPGGPVVSPTDALRDILSSVPGGAGSEFTRDLDNIERIRAGPTAGGKKPEEMSPQELHAVLWQVLTFRDSVMKKISKTIEKIPGLGPLLEKLMDSIAVFVFTTLDPFLRPILKVTTSGLQNASGEVIDTHDQYEVFNDPIASDPTHSFLSKDHFNLILNEPAGKIAQVIVVHTVKSVTRAWDDTSVNVHQVIEDILQCLFHPDFHNPNSQVQREMMQCMKDWINKVPNQHSVIQRLTKNAVRNHENIRLAAEGGAPASQGSFADGQAHQFQQKIQGYASGIPVVAQAQSLFGSREGPGAYGPPQTGQAASYYNDTTSSTSGGYSGASSYGPPAGAPPAAPQLHGGYAPSYAPPPTEPTSFPGATPGFPSGHGHGTSGHGASGHGATSPPPSFPGATPSFPGGHGHGASSPPPSFPGAGPTFPSSGYGPPAGPPGGYGPPQGPPPPHGGGPGFPDGPGGFGGHPPSGSPPFGFPGAQPYGAPPGGPQFPGAPGSGPSFPYGGGGSGGW